MEESSARTVCDISISAEDMTHHDDVSAGSQMERGHYEFIPRAKHRARGAFDGRGLSDRSLGHRAVQYP
jgi:hypothetical protein